jgi:hypothetical protein
VCVHGLTLGGLANSAIGESRNTCFMIHFIVGCINVVARVCLGNSRLPSVTPDAPGPAIAQWGSLGPPLIPKSLGSSGLWIQSIPLGAASVHGIPGPVDPWDPQVAPRIPCCTSPSVV